MRHRSLRCYKAKAHALFAKLSTTACEGANMQTAVLKGDPPIATYMWLYTVMIVYTKASYSCSSWLWTCGPLIAEVNPFSLRSLTMMPSFIHYTYKAFIHSLGKVGRICTFNLVIWILTAAMLNLTLPMIGAYCALIL